ncbi:MAG TPA: glycosyltransferase family 87 protein [Stellaceae bacterium]|nr:glycosyltransferase family 87 protein [Stellaceae bacterium]
MPRSAFAATGTAASSRSIPPVISAIALVAALYAWAVIALTPTHPGSIGLNLNALGTDWMVFWGGARWYFDGNLAALFDGNRFTAYLNTAFAGWLSQPMPFRPWVYPPTYLLIMLPFGSLPFTAGYVAFQVVTAALLAAALWFRSDCPKARGIVLTVALVGPAAAYNVGVGQNAFLTTALLVGGFRLLRTWPALGGILLGLLTLKPQFWLLVPVALFALRAWKGFFCSIATAVALVLISAAVFGVDVWWNWIEFARGNYVDAHGQWVEMGRLWGVSLYACLVSAGTSQSVANVVQFLGVVLGMALVYVAYRRPLSDDRKLAALLACTFFAAPHSSLHDMVFLATAAALWTAEAANRDKPLAQWTLALAIWLAPLINPPLVSLPGRFTPLLILGFVAMTLTNRSTEDHDMPRLGSRAAPVPAVYLRESGK